MFNLNVISILKAALNEHNAFIAYCATLPKEEADKLKAERQDRREKEDAHRKALEIADAGRTRNFWGN